MFGIRRFLRQVSEIRQFQTRLDDTGLTFERIGERLTKLERIPYFVDASETFDPLLPDVHCPVRYPFDLSAKEIISRFDEIYDHLKVRREVDLADKTVLQSTEEEK